MDISQREGKYPPPTGSSTILGVEFSGTIAEVHSGVSGWNVNDEVLGLAGGVSDSWLTLRVHCWSADLYTKIREPTPNTLPLIKHTS